ncbi:MAG: RNA polymerase sigma factor [Bacteroidota bacterium]
MSYTVTMSDIELIESCIANDRLAQKRLYERYKNAMYTIAVRITGDYDLASDVLQDAFINIFRGLKQFRKESTLGAWIKTIVVRTALKSIKKKIHFEPIENQNLSGFIDWGHQLDSEYLEKAIQALPEGYRAVFVLIEVEGYSHKEVAEMLGISVGTSKSQLFYSKKRLRKLVTQYSL